MQEQSQNDFVDGEDDTVFVYEGDEVYVEQITVADFNSKLDELFNTTTSKEQYESYRDQIEKIIMDELVRDEREKKEYKNARSYAGSHDRSVLFSDALLHDKHPDTAVAYKAKVKNTLGSDDVSLAAALQSADEWPMWKEAIKVELTSLIDKRHVFQIVKEDIPPEHQRRIYQLMILLKRNGNKLREISKYKCRLVMDGSRQRVGIDVFDTFSPVIDYTTVRMLISIAFGNGWKMFHWDISVAFTNADAHEPTYVMFPKIFRVIFVLAMLEVSLLDWPRISMAVRPHPSYGTSVCLNF